MLLPINKTDILLHSYVHCEWNPRALTSTAAEVLFKSVLSDTSKLISKCTAYCQTQCVLNLCANPSCLAPQISNNSIHSYNTPANLEIRLQHKNPICHAFKLAMPIRNTFTIQPHSILTMQK
jgi:hypothetical protein